MSCKGEILPVVSKEAIEDVPSLSRSPRKAKVSRNRSASYEAVLGYFLFVKMATREPRDFVFATVRASSSQSTTQLLSEIDFRLIVDFSFHRHFADDLKVPNSPQVYYTIHI